MPSSSSSSSSLRLEWRPLVLGCVDGLISGIAFTSGSVLNDVDRKSFVALGLGIILSEAFSMGASEFLSSLEEGAYKQGVCNALLCAFGFFASSLAPFLAILIFFSAERWIRLLSLVFVGLSLILVFSKLRSFSFHFSFPVSLLQTGVVVAAAFALSVGTNLIVLSVQ